MNITSMSMYSNWGKNLNLLLISNYCKEQVTAHTVHSEFNNAVSTNDNGQYKTAWRQPTCLTLCLDVP